MNKLLLFLNLLTFQIIFSYTYECYKFNLNVCCDNFCAECGSCINNLNIDKLCCRETIIQNGIYCEKSNNPPCIITKSDLLTKSDLNSNENISKDKKENDIDRLITWVKSLQLYQLVLFIIACCIVVLFILYSCCCFGSNKKPPLDYALIVGKYN